MPITLEDDKAELLRRATDLALEDTTPGGPPREDVAALLTSYYRHVAPEDVCDRSDVDLIGALGSHYRLAAHRPQGTARVRVLTPSMGEHGWTACGHSVVEVVTDDMPFLVDSLTMALTGQDRGVHVVVHPQFEVTRDVAGELRSVAPAEEGVVPGGSEDPDRSGAIPGGETLRESWMHIEIDRLPEDEDVSALEHQLESALRDVRESVEDWDKMRARALQIVAAVEQSPPPLPAEELEQSLGLLRWLADEHFTFLGCRDYDLVREGEDDVLHAVPGSGLGILRADPDLSDTAPLPPEVAKRAREKTLLVLSKANSRATVHRPVHLDYVGIKRFDAAGDVVGEHRFLGLFSSAAYTESLTRIPLLREKALEVLQRVGFDPRSHAGKTLLYTLENYPRDELFQTPVDELAPIAEAVMYTRERRQLRVFVRRDTYGRYLSVLVYLPRDRYNTGVRERFAAILKERLGGDNIEFNARVAESVLARVHFVVRPPAGRLIEEADIEDLERRLAEAARSWRDDFMASVVGEYGEAVGSRLGRHYAGSFPEAYKEDFSPHTGAADVGRIEHLGRTQGDEGLDLTLYRPVGAGPREGRLKVFRTGAPLSLSQILPMLTSMGVEVVDERPYELEGLARPTHVYDFGLRYDTEPPAGSKELFEETLLAIRDQAAEIDGFNQLVLAAQLSWRQVTVLRAYAKYMKQGGTPFALSSIQNALIGNVDITRLLVQLFEARFDPGRGTVGATDEARRARMDEVEQRIERALDDVVSLDHDRILRSYLIHLRSTLRTNFFQQRSSGGWHRYLSLKLDPSGIPDLPEPRPRFEIFVHSPRVEGVHLRFGSVARGGLRWSDRRDDFRTEVLGLVKAQMVKNTVIVPVGAKGGFYCKQLPDPGDREAWMAEGIACYRTFISGLLDLTDNLVDGDNVAPRDVVCHDPADSYLVVAADKGTATFSDIANDVAAKYGFWLGDAFASGGSVGYDHKAMGITARGAWVSVRRHFREMGIDCQSEDITVVGIGDMSGDVFGNGMLCSEHIRLVAAFDHRDIFLDPDPDAAASYAERRRLFEKPRSSWRDYDPELISEGGGVHSRTAKSIKITPQVRAALGLDDAVVKLTPAELIRAILLAPVDLLWNGGIGTYVKASTESHADAGDKANDTIRVDGGELRARCVGEGGNLGLTQRGRIEYAVSGADGRGGRINTDFIDNSAGVDTSDHEVNIKILLDRVVAAGEMAGEERDELLASMTDQVADLVLRDNYEQNLALSNAASLSTPLLHVHEDWMKRLEREGLIDRDLEALPSSREVRRRLEVGEGLSLPELSVLLAWTKIALADELLASDLPDDPFLRADLYAYFPEKMRQGYREQMDEHPLRREIVVTQVVNDLVNGAGMTFWPRLEGETGASAAELTRANFVAREIYGSLALRDELASYDNVLDARVQTQMRLEMRTLVERASRWLVNNRRPPVDSEGVVDFFGVTIQRVVAQLPELLTGHERHAFSKRRDDLVQRGVPEELATRVAVLPPAYMLLGVVETATREGLDPTEVARVHFAVGERLGLPPLVSRILALPREDRWQTMARAALRDDLHAVHGQITAQVLASTPPGDAPEARVAAWEAPGGPRAERATDTLEEICADDGADLARLSVGLRVVRGLLVGG
ncbi:NAD-glutamate dehydrogenase [Nocardioides pacificus]